MALTIETLSCFETNYCYFLCDHQAGVCAVVDPGDGVAVAQWLRGTGLSLRYILCTHHHSDHTGGNLALKQQFGAEICGPASDRARIPGLDTGLREDDDFEVFGQPIKVLETPGHTRGSICFLSGSSLFTGDTLFAMGCGRLFEGDAATMLHSLEKLSALPGETRIYPGHEYALADARFAITLEPANMQLQRRLKAAESGPAGAVTLADELATNPFLRVRSGEIREVLHMHPSSDAEVFAQIRQRKDNA